MSLNFLHTDLTSLMVHHENNNDYEKERCKKFHVLILLLTMQMYEFCH